MEVDLVLPDILEEASFMFQELNMSWIEDVCRNPFTIKDKPKNMTKEDWEREIYRPAYLQKLEVKKHRAKYMRDWVNKKIQRRLHNNISCGVYHSLKGMKNDKWKDILDFTLGELIWHLMNLWQEGMSWENYGRGGWQIDHFIPVSSFDLSSPDPSDFKKCWALENLQPMWEKDNIRKRNKISDKFKVKPRKIKMEKGVIPIKNRE